MDIMLAYVSLVETMDGYCSLDLDLTYTTECQEDMYTVNI